jgi:hypothetical protein
VRDRCFRHEIFAFIADIRFAFDHPREEALVKGHTVAQKVQVTFVDDLDGSAADETIRFALGRDTYEIDLSKGNAKKLRDALAVYVNASRRVGGGRGRPAGRATTRSRGRGRASAGGASPAQIRAWAKSRGIKVNERGRIAADIVAKYEAAH